MRPENRRQVKELTLFRAMPDAAFDRLLAGSFFQRFPAHVVLIREGDLADFLHIVIDGGVELFSNWRDHETTISIARPISTFILAAVVKDAPYLMSARTLDASSILMIPSENIRTAMLDDSAFGVAMVDELAACFREIVKAQKNLKLRSGVERLANYLLRLDAEQRNDGRVVLPFEKKLLASLLNMTPENLSRAFATLKPYGVAVSAAAVEIANPGDLRRFAKPTPLIDDPKS
ncbi:MAG: transcriptional regulator [Alphaproteobacteria bacterium RIFCSPHIGHO2_12_FULL_63_12]|nr:MAG: transcriptional regulator [Alphaproteobacteria bacterium RIFCSPHIGHO2_12_FULL_63_12]